jgi:hypothetical protein
MGGAPVPIERGGTFGFVAGTLVSSVALGLIVIIATLLAFDALRPAGDTSLTPGLYILFGGTVVGILVAAGAAWHLLEPIQSAYRRGGLAMVCAFATVLAMLICIPLHQLFGRAGLVALLVVCALASALLVRRVRRYGVGM